ncbi:NAD-dependent epimerase/dehydratase family protein [Geomonas sp. RF6]|uniref:NAD-dependent epimerase/dehydratase family protein n=1 Tax=Geomonas sp. RF6 TaxID=2897342 RepID=UPI001E638CB9|nr:NAD-dependent epimerase/dehydratase family protein [Geomonas sp. RF6]UFS69330.1 NAD-dependent epimerase/dehydratase family protein [Geomonas sp. RF6]
MLLRDTLFAFNPDYVIHLAAVPPAPTSMEAPEEAFRAIVRGTNNTLMCIKDLPDLQRYVHISSSMVYGDFVYAPADEEHPKAPKEIYGAYKYCTEVITRTFCPLYGIDYAIVRPTAIYGPSDGNDHVLANFLRNALDGKPIVVKGADLRFDFTFVEDVAQGITRATFAPEASSHVFNIARGEGRTLSEAAQIVADLVPGTEIEYRQPDRRLPVRGALDITNARTLLG